MFVNVGPWAPSPLATTYLLFQYIRTYLTCNKFNLFIYIRVHQYNWKKVWFYKYIQTTITPVLARSYRHWMQTVPELSFGINTVHSFVTSRIDSATVCLHPHQHIKLTNYNVCWMQQLFCCFAFQDSTDIFQLRSRTTLIGCVRCSL